MGSSSGPSSNRKGSGREDGTRGRIPPPISTHESEATDWSAPISNFLRQGTLSADLRERVHIRRTALRYVFVNEEGRQVLKETHAGICGVHRAGPKLHMKVKRLGYHWPSMLRDAIELA
ncbi:hypothetical protein H6P81_016275 [Aristolochia fimbriata]|uniref:Integrase zinc-binding domain-containing protein n=1 Tax=Aristolochia fimbriata TaxID=158543 RepID=A0AAV7E7T0_ARIFI|nr:hypothetical protein H6P81_016275 [Aristolochia fimbriata]